MSSVCEDACGPIRPRRASSSRLSTLEAQTPTMVYAAPHEDLRGTAPALPAPAAMATVEKDDEASALHV